MLDMLLAVSLEEAEFKASNADILCKVKWRVRRYRNLVISDGLTPHIILARVAMDMSRCFACVYCQRGVLSFTAKPKKTTKNLLELQLIPWIQPVCVHYIL